MLLETNIKQTQAAADTPLADVVERRQRPRIVAAFPAKVRGTDASGESFELDTVIDNFNAGGLYMNMPRCIAPGTKLSITVRLSASQLENIPAPLVATRADVLRAEPKADNTCGVAVAFTNHKFL